MTQTGIEAARAAIRARTSWKPVEWLFWGAIAVCYVLFPTHLLLLTQIVVSGLFAMSLDILLGYGGIPSFGHAAFFGIGAYAAGLLAAHGWGEPLTGLAAAGLVAGAAGLLFSVAVARVQSTALLMVTLCVGLLVYEAANRSAWLTGGDTGLQGVDMWPIFGRFDFDIYGRTAFWYCYGVAFLLYIGARAYVSSPEGLALEAMRENESRIAVLGISAARRKRLAFTIAAVVAGMAGALLAQTTQVVALETLSFDRSVSALIILIVGGVGSLIGGFVGAAAFVWAHEFLSKLSPVYWMFWLGLALIALVLTFQGGLVGAVESLSRKFTHRRTRGRS